MEFPNIPSKKLPYLRVIFLFVLMLFITAQVNAQTPLTTPYTFTNGEIIDADNINQNFSEIATHINQNQGHKHLYIVDGNGSELGAISDFKAGVSPEFLSSKGYYAAIKTNPEPTATLIIFFESVDCTGQGYTNSPVLDDLTLRNNLKDTRSLFWNELDSKYYYIDLRNAPVTITATSNYRFSRPTVCIIPTAPQLPVVNPLVVNDPAITGVPNEIVFPIRLEYK